MVTKIEQKQGQALSKIQECLNELILYTYLSGLQDGKENWNENEDILDEIGNNRISKIIGELSLN